MVNHGRNAHGDNERGKEDGRNIAAKTRAKAAV